MANSRQCTRCGRFHWQEAKLCAECSDEEIRKATQPIIDRNRVFEEGAGRDAEQFFTGESRS